MNKPTPRPRKSVLNYHECEDYLEAKCGKRLRDFANKYGEGGCPDNEYQDFWHYLCHSTGLSNGSVIIINDYGAKPWQQEIIKMFHEEFGSDAEYLVEW